MRQIAAVLLLTSGCATVPKTAMVDGRQVPRLTLEYSGNPYSIKHEGAHPKPGGASSGLSDAGGAIHGRVCGMFFDFDVTHKGDHVQLVGSVDNRMPAAIDVSEHDGVRHFTGNLSTLGVDFTVDSAQMLGHVGTRVFAMESLPDRYQGHMRIPGLIGHDTATGAMAVILTGRQALWEMPPADQAAVLPAILTCTGLQGSSSQMVSNLVVGFGGAATDRPPESSALYTHGR